MFTKKFTKKRIIFGVCIVLLLFLIWFVPDFMKYRRVLKASSSFPHQVGLMKSVLTKCVLDPNTSTCPNHNLCVVAPGECTKCTAVDGTPSGGMGSQVLLEDTTITQIGLANGLSYIGGGMSPVFMNVSASVGGTTKTSFIEKTNRFVDWFDFIIAGFRN